MFSRKLLAAYGFPVKQCHIRKITSTKLFLRWFAKSFCFTYFKWFCRVECSNVCIYFVASTHAEMRDRNHVKWLSFFQSYNFLRNANRSIFLRCSFRLLDHIKCHSKNLSKNENQNKYPNMDLNVLHFKSKIIANFNSHTNARFKRWRERPRE